MTRYSRTECTVAMDGKNSEKNCGNLRCCVYGCVEVLGFVDDV